MDIFGMAFRDYLDGKTTGVLEIKTNLSETETLPVSYFFRSYGDMPRWEQQVMDQCGGRVLDAGAGAGCHALELQQRGLDVTAVDISEGAAKAMRRRGVRKVINGDFFSIGPGDAGFDTILFLMNGAGMAGSLDRLGVLLQKAAGLLRPGGTIYLESTDLMYMYMEEDGSVMLPMGANYYGEIEYVIRYQGQSTPPFPWLFVDPDNLAGVASRCGLTTEVICQGNDHNYVATLKPAISPG